MPQIEEIATISANGSTYRDWTSVRVSSTLTDPPRSFTFSLAEPDSKRGGFASIRLKPGDFCTVNLAGHKVAEGFVAERQTAYDANRHGVQIMGYSRAIDMIDSSVDVKGGGQFQNYTFKAIAEKVLKQVGLTYSEGKMPEGADKPLRNVIIHHGETIHEFIERLARQRGIRISDDDKGNIVGGLPKGGSGDLEEGRNILSANCTITDANAWYRTTVRGQTQGSDDSWGKAIAQSSAFATNSEMRDTRKLILIAEEPGTKKEMQNRADQESAHQIGTSVQCVVTVQGWLKAGGDLWKVADKVKVKSPMLFPNSDGSMDLVVLQTVHAQDSAAGTTTTMTLVLEQMFGTKGGLGSSNGGGFFSPNVQGAQPE